MIETESIYRGWLSVIENDEIEFRNGNRSDLPVGIGCKEEKVLWLGEVKSPKLPKGLEDTQLLFRVGWAGGLCLGFAVESAKWLPVHGKLQ
jgi:hypothetical protein